MAEISEDASELEKLIRDCEFENQQYVKLIEKENQTIEALGREIEWKTEETHRLQQSISQLDNDTKQYHKQFTINRDNCENLKKTGQVLTEHIAAMTNKLELATMRRKQEGEEHGRLLEHYRTMWDNYKARYESWPNVKRLRAQQTKEQAARTKTEEMKARLDEAKAKLEELKVKKNAGDVKAVLIKIAESYKRRQQIVKEIEIKKQEIERMRNEDEHRQQQAMQANTMETLNNQLKESHIEDEQRAHDEMETNQIQTSENEEPASPMISVFSGRSDVEEDMQTGELQAVSRGEQKGSLDTPYLQGQDQQMMRKSQSWLENYQEQNQKHPGKPSELGPADQIHHQEEVPQKPSAQHNDPQRLPPFVAFHNARQQQGLEDMDATVSIHLPARSEEKLGTSHIQPEDHTPSKSKPTTYMMPSTSQSAGQQSAIGFTNPAFRTSPNPPRFTVPIMQTRPASHMPPSIQANQRSTAIPQLTSARPVKSPALIRPPIQSSSASQAPVRAPVPTISSSRIPVVSLPQQKTAVQSANLRMPQNLVNTPQSPQTTRPLQRVQFPSLRASTPQRPITSQAPPFLIRPPVPSIHQAQKLAPNPPQQARPQFQPDTAAHQSRAQLHTPASSVHSFTAVPISQTPVSMMQKIPHVTAPSKPQISSASPSLGSTAIQMQTDPRRAPSPSKSQPQGQSEMTQPPLHQAIPSSPTLMCQKSEAQRRGQGFEGHQTMSGQQSDSHMETSRTRTPQSSPVPMHTSPYISTEDGDTATVHTPEHERPSFLQPEGETSSPFSMEKHKERVKNINKSPGQPLFTADRRMFDGAKIFDKTSTFSIFGGGDGFHLPAFDKSAEEKTSGLSNGITMTSSESMKVPSFLQTPDFDGKATSSSSEVFSGQGPKDSTFSFNFDSFSIGTNDKDKGDSGFSFDFGQVPKESQFNFDFGSFGSNLKSPSNEPDKTNDSTGFSFDFCRETKDSGLNFNFDSFESPKSPSNNEGEMFGNSGNNDFSFNFGGDSSASGPEATQKFSLF